MNDSYDSDIVIWSEEQAALLRRVASGERINDAALDWPNIIAEIESVGNEQVRAVESLLFQAFVHDLTALAWPASPEVPHWQTEARLFRGRAALRYAPSMRQRIDLAKLFARACRLIPKEIDRQAAGAMPATCTASLEEILAEDYPGLGNST
jgi:hypothetical protein